MRILYVTNNSHLRSTTLCLHAVLKELIPKGLQPVMVFKEPGPWQRELADDGTPIWYHSLRIPNKSQPVQLLRDVAKLIYIVRRHKIELIHCSEHDHYPLLRLVSRWTRVPIVTTLHFKLDSGFGHWAFKKPYEPAALQFISRAQLDYSEPALPPGICSNRVRLIMSGLAIDDFVKRGNANQSWKQTWQVDNTDTVVIGTASSIRPHKNLDQFVQLISNLRNQNLPVLGVIAGGGQFSDPDYKKQLEHQINEAGLAKHCFMVGNVSPMAPVLKAFDIFVSTSQWETFGMSICEAMACATPVVVYDVGGNAEAVPDSWCVTPYPNLKALTEKVAKLVRDEKVRHAMGQDAARHVRKHFDAPVLARRQLAIYEEILGRPLRIGS